MFYLIFVIRNFRWTYSIIFGFNIYYTQNYAFLRSNTIGVTLHSSCMIR